MACPNTANPQKTYISLTDPKSKINRSAAYTAKGVLSGVAALDVGFLCAVRIFPNKKTARHPKGNLAAFPRFVGCDSTKAFYGMYVTAL